ncbi:MAG: TIGR00159 family protein [Acidobacteria bacterium]|nr:TIGR00159 family protein [Acidobacteriota bacterium]
MAEIFSGTALQGGIVDVVRSLAEIAVLAYLVYQLIRVMRGGRAVPVLFGVLLIVGLYYAAGVVGFTAIQNILAALSPYAAIALIVIFQTEIRGALRETALRFAPTSRSRKTNYEYEDVVFAMGQLTATRTGALIVVERETGLKTFIQSGVALDARLSADLLTSIFQRSAPLHDGGVIIQKGRVAAAACFLPLTTNPGLVSTLGTRHRAAIGVTEESDCVALVVSETDGKISVAFNGNIERGISMDRLRLRMIQYLGPVVFPPQGMAQDSAAATAAAGGDSGLRRDSAASIQAVSAGDGD